MIEQQIKVEEEIAVSDGMVYVTHTDTLACVEECTSLIAIMTPGILVTYAGSEFRVCFDKDLRIVEHHLHAERQITERLLQ